MWNAVNMIIGFVDGCIHNSNSQTRCLRTIHLDSVLIDELQEIMKTNMFPRDWNGPRCLCFLTESRRY